MMIFIIIIIVSNPYDTDRNKTQFDKETMSYTT